MTLWKINCMEGRFPGMWHRWYRHQCVAVGWHAKWGYPLVGDTDDIGWQRTRASLKHMKKGDQVVVALQNHQVGRLGEITATHKSDGDWKPLVPPSKHLPDGEMGRRIEVRWDLSCGPEDPDLVIALPHNSRFSTGELRPTIAEIRSRSVERLRDVMGDSSNWVGLLAHFQYESALSQYIAAYPHQLEDGLVPHPDKKVRELVFKDKTRVDVLLLDRQGRPVVVECKQGPAEVKHLDQLRAYMHQLHEETGGKEARGILVHGGARKLPVPVENAASISPAVEVVQSRLRVDFASSTGTTTGKPLHRGRRRKIV